MIALLSWPRVSFTELMGALWRMPTRGIPLGQRVQSNTALPLSGSSFGFSLLNPRVWESVRCVAVDEGTHFSAQFTCSVPGTKWT